jgi:gluconate 2-dehydrogenase gamma chain
MIDDERRTLAAAMSCILPDDAMGPGATAAGAIDFVDTAIVNGYCPRSLPQVLRGLPLLDDCASAMFGRAFVACDPEDRDAVLRRLREVPHRTVQRFLVSLVRVTIAGFLSAPRHGGNRNGCGWRYVGYVPHHRTAVRYDEIAVG